jgi:hypothetical protein
MIRLGNRSSGEWMSATPVVYAKDGLSRSKRDASGSSHAHSTWTHLVAIQAIIVVMHLIEHSTFQIRLVGMSHIRSRETLFRPNTRGGITYGECFSR